MHKQNVLHKLFEITIRFSSINNIFFITSFTLIKELAYQWNFQNNSWEIEVLPYLHICMYIFSLIRILALFGVKQTLDSWNLKNKCRLKMLIEWKRKRKKKLSKAITRRKMICYTLKNKVNWFKSEKLWRKTKEEKFWDACDDLDEDGIKIVAALKLWICIQISAYFVTFEHQKTR